MSTASDKVLKTDPAEFVCTVAASRMLTTLNFARQHGKIAVICGEAGIGKTYSASYYEGRDPYVWIVPMSPASASLSGSLDGIAQHMGIPQPGQFPGRVRMMVEIERWLFESEGLLVVDDAHYLEAPALTQLVSIQKDTGVGLVFMGKTGLLACFERDEWLRGQVDWGIRLGPPDAEDVNRFLAAGGVQDSEIRKLCNEIASRPGTIRSLANALNWAKAKAMSEHVEFGVRHMEAACAELAQNWWLREGPESEGQGMPCAALSESGRVIA